MDHTDPYIVNSANRKWERLKAGERVIVSNEELDALAARFTDDDGPEAALYFSSVASIPNPQQMGTRDQFIAWIG